MRKLASILVLIVTLLLPSMSYSEDYPTQLLAKTIFANTRGQSYEAMLAFGSIIMNRVNDKAFPGTIEAVINQKHQFAYGNNYDEISLEVARQLMKGNCTLPNYVLYTKTITSKQEWSNKWLYKTLGNLQFYIKKS